MTTDEPYDVRVEWDEGGCYVIVDGPSLDPEYQAGEYRFRLEDPEVLYDRVKAAIGPWLREREEAFSEFRQAVRSGTRPAAAFLCAAEDIDESGGYAANDPKSPGYHDRMSTLADDRDAFTIYAEEDR